MSLNKILADIVEAYGWTVSNPNSRNSLLKDWLNAAIESQGQASSDEPQTITDSLVIEDGNMFTDEGVIQ